MLRFVIWLIVEIIHAGLPLRSMFVITVSATLAIFDYTRMPSGTRRIDSAGRARTIIVVVTLRRGSELRREAGEILGVNVRRRAVRDLFVQGVWLVGDAELLLQECNELVVGK